MSVSATGDVTSVRERSAPRITPTSPMEQEMRNISRLLQECERGNLENFLPSLVSTQDEHLILEIVRNAINATKTLEVHCNYNPFLSSSKMVASKKTPLDQVLNDFVLVLEGLEEYKGQKLINEIIDLVTYMQDEGTRCVYLTELIDLGLGLNSLKYIEALRTFRDESYKSSLIELLIQKAQKATDLNNLHQIVLNFVNEPTRFNGLSNLAKAASALKDPKANRYLESAKALAAQSTDVRLGISAGLTHLALESDKGSRPNPGAQFAAVMEIEDVKTRLEALETFFTFLQGYTNSLNIDDLPSWLRQCTSLFVDPNAAAHKSLRYRMLRSLIQYCPKVLPFSKDYLEQIERSKDYLKQIESSFDTSSDPFDSTMLQAHIALFSAYATCNDQVAALHLLDGIFSLKMTDRNTAFEPGTAALEACDVLPFSFEMKKVFKRQVLEKVKTLVEKTPKDTYPPDDLDEVKIAMARGYFEIGLPDDAGKVLKEILTNRSYQRNAMYSSSWGSSLSYISLSNLRESIRLSIKINPEFAMQAIIQYAEELEILKLLEEFPVTFWQDHTTAYRHYAKLSKELPVGAKSLAQLIFLLNASKKVS